MATGWWWWWWHWWPCFWGYRYRWEPSGRADSSGSGSDSRSCPCPWRYALAILQQSMVMAHLDVAVPGSGMLSSVACSFDAEDSGSSSAPVMVDDAPPLESDTNLLWSSLDLCGVCRGEWSKSSSGGRERRE